jgi:diguanylate cyclase (GGDEF)-like protein
LATAQLRPTDSFGTIGGEESAMLPDTDEQDAVRLAERLRTAFAANVHAVGGRAVTATVSVGFACSDGADSDVDALLKAADEALYRAKIAGRNRV